MYNFATYRTNKCCSLYWHFILKTDSYFWATPYYFLKTIEIKYMLNYTQTLK